MSDAWDELRRRYPWPEECPSVAPNDRGWCRPGIVEYLKRVLSVDMHLIFELGSWMGLSARHILRYAPNARLVCVDHWLGCRADRPGHRPFLYETFIRNMWEWRDRIVPMRMMIQNALPELKDLGFQPDLIYVDGDHATEYAYADTKHSHELFPDAQIIGDDWQFESVRDGVHRYAAEINAGIEHNKTGWILKP